jgi:octaprenyl-diphosphate synthase
LRLYGMAIGTAYQVYDDCLDLFGSEAAAGKSLGTDLAKGKLTLPLLLALEQASPGDRHKLELMVRNWHSADYPTLLKLLRDYRTLDGSRDAVHQQLDLARHHLADLPATRSRTALDTLTTYLAWQTKSLGPAE